MRTSLLTLTLLSMLACGSSPPPAAPPPGDRPPRGGATIEVDGERFELSACFYSSRKYSKSAVRPDFLQRYIVPLPGAKADSKIFVGLLKAEDPQGQIEDLLLTRARELPDGDLVLALSFSLRGSHCDARVADVEEDDYVGACDDGRRVRLRVNFDGAVKVEVPAWLKELAPELMPDQGATRAWLEEGVTTKRPERFLDPRPPSGYRTYMRTGHSRPACDGWWIVATDRRILVDASLGHQDGPYLVAPPMATLLTGEVVDVTVYCQPDAELRPIDLCGSRRMKPKVDRERATGAIDRPSDGNRVRSGRGWRGCDGPLVVLQAGSEVAGALG